MTESLSRDEDAVRRRASVSASVKERLHCGLTTCRSGQQ